MGAFHKIEPRYVDVVLRRWATLTGKTPIRESDGVAFEGVACAEAT